MAKKVAKIEKVAKVGVKKQEGYLYFVDKKGNVARQKSIGSRKKGKANVEVVAKVGIKMKPNYLYFIDKHGDISAAKMLENFEFDDNSFHGEHITCNDCSFTWQIKKLYGKPLKCYKCGSNDLRIRQLDELEEDDNDPF